MVTAATRNWEQTFRDWSKPSSDTESQKSDRAERMIREALRSHPWFAPWQPTIYTKGSYENNTNVRLDSDVYVVVESTAALYSQTLNVPAFIVGAAGLYVPAPYEFAFCKNEVHAALRAMFGAAGVTRGDKAFDVHENTARVDADVVAAFEYCVYYGTGPTDYHRGSKFISDTGTVIINWPLPTVQLFRRGDRRSLCPPERYQFRIWHCCDSALATKP